MRRVVQLKHCKDYKKCGALDNNIVVDKMRNLDYPNYIFQSPFDNAESFKSLGWGIFMEHPVKYIKYIKEGGRILNPISHILI